jgi:hypothetical protein
MNIIGNQTTTVIEQNPAVGKPKKMVTVRAVNPAHIKDWHQKITLQIKSDEQKRKLVLAAFVTYVGVQGYYAFKSVFGSSSTPPAGTGTQQAGAAEPAVRLDVFARMGNALYQLPGRTLDAVCALPGNFGAWVINPQTWINGVKGLAFMGATGVAHHHMTRTIEGIFHPDTISWYVSKQAKYQIKLALLKRYARMMQNNEVVAGERATFRRIMITLVNGLVSDVEKIAGFISFKAPKLDTIEKHYSAKMIIPDLIDTTNHFVRAMEQELALVEGKSHIIAVVDRMEKNIVSSIQRFKNLDDEDILSLAEQRKPGAVAALSAADENAVEEFDHKYMGATQTHVRLKEQQTAA